MAKKPKKVPLPPDADELGKPIGVIDNDLGLKAPALEAPRSAVPVVTDKTVSVTEVPLVVPVPRYRTPDFDGNYRHVKNPSIVVRIDGRYGVARAMSIGEVAIRIGEIGDRFDTSRSSGFVHEEVTYATKGEAERRAWKLAREIGSIGDWP